MLARVAVVVRAHSVRTRGVSPGSVRSDAEAMLRALRLADCELSIVLCDDRRMRSLNRRHRGKDRTTDVLAFALHDGITLGFADPRWLGDVVISLPTAARQARAQGKGLVDEVRMLLAHGLLHLLGDDHRTLAQARRMSARTDALRAAARARPRTLRGGTSGPERPPGRPVGFSTLAERRIGGISTSPRHTAR
jgi:probable rRNA maturation factor